MKGYRREVLVRLREVGRRFDANGGGASVRPNGTMRGMVRGCGALPGHLPRGERRTLKGFATAVAHPSEPALEVE